MKTSRRVFSLFSSSLLFISLALFGCTVLSGTFSRGDKAKGALLDKATPLVPGYLTWIKVEAEYVNGPKLITGTNMGLVTIRFDDLPDVRIDCLVGMPYQVPVSGRVVVGAIWLQAGKDQYVWICVASDRVQGEEPLDKRTL